ncbi:MAG: DUF63 family protein [Candidatus Hodarchaeota archaeon]
MAMNQSFIEDLLDKLFQDILLLFTNPIAFFDTYFFSALGYNLYNTIVYTTLGLIGILVISLVIQSINKKGTERWGEERYIPIKMDSEFFVVILPYIFIGSTLRAIQDIANQGKIITPYEFFADRLFVTPGVYIVTITLTLVAGFFSIFVSQEYLQGFKHFSNWRVLFFSLGICIEGLLFFPILVLLITNSDLEFLIGGGSIILLSILFSLIFHLLAKILSKRLIPDSPIRTEEELSMITQMFDAFNTVIAIEFFNYQEKHYLPAILFNTPFGSWPFLVIKFIIVLLFIWTLRGLENRSQEKWLLWVIFLLGLATGTRDFLRLITNT